MTLALVRDEGLNVGLSSGVNVSGAIRLARTLGPGKTIVTMLCDPATRYQSRLFNPEFLRSKALMPPEWLEQPQSSNLTWCRTIGAPSQLSGRHQ